MIEGALDRAEVPQKERAARMAEPLGRAGFTDMDTPTAALSGGWRKRLAIVEGLVQAPDILLLDEPTNHLDLAGIQWLETLLQNAAFACVVVSHDRYFLENVATAVVELARIVREWFSARQRKLQHVSRGEGRISSRPAQAAGSAGKPACTRKSNGCAAAPRPEPQNRKRASIPRTN